MLNGVGRRKRQRENDTQPTAILEFGDSKISHSTELGILAVAWWIINIDEQLPN